jgi:surfeit locus 1 family protein
LRRGVAGPTLAMLPVLGILVGLGAWQLARKAEKEALIAAVEARAFGEAVALPQRDAWAGADPGRLDFQKVRLDGRFRAAPEFRLYTIVSDRRGGGARPGWMIYQPFDLASGGTVIVGRGVVPEPLGNSGARVSAPPPEGDVTLEGLVRAPEQRGLFAASDDPARNAWHTRDARAFARSAGLEAAPFTVEQSTPNPGGVPLAGTTRVSFANRHLEYALTWYGLALGLVLVTVAYLARGRGTVRPGA